MPRKTKPAPAPPAPAPARKTTRPVAVPQSPVGELAPPDPALRIGSIDWFTSNPGDIYSRYLAYVRAGSFPYVAAQAVGVSRSTIDRWLSLGRRQKRGAYRNLAEDTARAVGEARVVAETSVAAKSPLEYLRRGAGRTLGDEWTDNPEPAQPATQQAHAVPHSDLGAALLELHKAGLLHLIPGTALTTIEGQVRDPDGTA